MVSYVIFHGGTNNVVNKMAKQLEKRKLFVIQLADKLQKNLEKTSCAHVSSAFTGRPNCPSLLTA